MRVHNRRLEKVEAQIGEQVKAERKAAIETLSEWRDANTTQAEQDAYWRFILAYAEWVGDEQTEEVKEWRASLGEPQASDAKVFAAIEARCPQALEARVVAAFMRRLPGESAIELKEISWTAGLRAQGFSDEEIAVFQAGGYYYAGNDEQRAKYRELYGGPPQLTEHEAEVLRQLAARENHGMPDEELERALSAHAA